MLSSLLESIRLAQHNPTVKVGGLRDRLQSHRSGRRSGDQFCLYVFDRLVLPALSAEQIAAAAKGLRPLDEDVRALIHDRLSYRWVAVAAGEAAYKLETILVTRGLGGSLPVLNPRRVK